jgi:hypothetical protein
MIRRPGQLVNEGLALSSATLPPLEGFDLQLSIDNVVALGGSERLYRHFLGRALTVPDADVLAIASLAAWRAGVIDLRADALHRLEMSEPVSAAAALGIELDDLGAFVVGQARSAFAWTSTLPVIARVGGFRGLGGAFISPPLSATTLEREGGFALLTAVDAWEYDADTFGGRLVRVDEPGDPGPVRDVQLTVSPDSYLAELVLA